MAVALLYDPVFLEHDTGDHPENAERLRGVLARLEAKDRLGTLALLAVPAAARDDLEAVHDARYLDALEAACASGGGWVDVDTPFSSRSYDAAVRAAGAAVRAVEATLAGVGWALPSIRRLVHL